MSIATLKKKSQAQYRNLSVRQPQFSINGTHRSQGYVGQTMLSRSLPKTLMNGIYPRGHGGCCGTYLVKPVIQCPSTRSLNNASIVKPSVMNNSGMISTQYRWIRRPQPFMTVKPDDNNNINSQQQYVERMKNTTLAQVAQCNVAAGTTIPTVKKIPCCLKSKNYNYKPKYVKTDPAKVENLRMSQSQYIEYKIHNSCVTSDVAAVLIG
jgi:hypothetical protein